MRRVSERRRLTATAALCAALATGWGAGIASPAFAAAAPSGSGTSDGLTLWAVSLPVAASRLAPGEPVHWPITADLVGDRPVVLAAEVRADGALAAHPAGLRLGLRSCDVAWQDTTSQPICPSGERTVMAVGGTEAVAAPHDLRTATGSTDVHLLVTAMLSESARSDPSAMGLRADVELTVTATETDEESTVGVGGAHPRPGLGSTGGDPRITMTLLAVGVVCLVVAAWTRARPGRDRGGRT
ncbi:hypothetical protein [Microbacterium sp. cf332]|uniref:hypothetical protein n=1 Tax=Microbacterium sp. cf332 TaxID=1761804 RepID=UPI000885485C|nr:hypothetical protein [Microbacterium sp. cf332]SDQ20830.1 hypothetical protein SAMN04487847_0889 [Microbacterium sp. cf332]